MRGLKRWISALWIDAVTIERIVIVLSLVAIAVFTGARYRLRGSHTSSGPFFTDVSPQATSSRDAAANSLSVTVAGAVQKPGRYTFGPNARVQDAVRAAGGFTANADPDGINQAAYLENESRISVPSRRR